MHDATTGNTATPKNWFTTTVEIISQALPQLRPQKDEKPGVRNKRVALFLCERWGMQYATFRGLKVGSQGRRPNPEKHPEFFKDLEKYGRARMKGAKVENLGKGPTVLDWIRDRTKK